MPLVSDPQGLLITLIDKIRYEKDNALLSQNIVDVAHRRLDRCKPVLGLIGQELAYNSQDVLPSLLRWYELFDDICKDQRADSIIVFDGRKRQQGCQLRSQLILEPANSTEIFGSAQV